MKLGRRARGAKDLGAECGRVRGRESSERANATGMAEGNNSPGRYGGASGERVDGQKGGANVSVHNGLALHRWRGKGRIGSLVHFAFVTCTSSVTSRGWA